MRCLCFWNEWDGGQRKNTRLIRKGAFFHLLFQLLHHDLSGWKAVCLSVSSLWHGVIIRHTRLLTDSPARMNSSIIWYWDFFFLKSSIKLLSSHCQTDIMFQHLNHFSWVKTWLGDSVQAFVLCAFKQLHIHTNLLVLSLYTYIRGMKQSSIAWAELKMIFSNRNKSYEKLAHPVSPRPSLNGTFTLLLTALAQNNKINTI